MIEVLKRDKKTKECFQEHKIHHAIENAYLSVGKSIDEDVFECVLERLGVREISDENTLINVEDIQDGIEKCLFDYDVEVAISFHDYRNLPRNSCVKTLKIRMQMWMNIHSVAEWLRQVMYIRRILH